MKGFIVVTVHTNDFRHTRYVRDTPGNRATIEAVTTANAPGAEATATTRMLVEAIADVARGCTVTGRLTTSEYMSVSEFVKQRDGEPVREPDSVSGSESDTNE